MAYWCGVNFSYSGASWAQRDGGWTSSFGPGYGEFKVYDGGSMYWNFDLRAFAQQNPGYNLSAIRLQVNAKSNSGAHTIGYTVYPVNTNLGDFRQHPANYGFGQYSGAGALGGSARFDWWNRLEYKQMETGLYVPVPFSKLAREPLVVRGQQAQPRRWASVFDARIVAIEAWRDRPTFPGWASAVMSQSGKPVPGWASALMGGGHWLSEFRGGREYLGFGVPRRLIYYRFQIDDNAQGWINFATGQTAFGIQNDTRCWTTTFDIGEQGRTWYPGLHGSGHENYNWIIWAQAYFPDFHFNQSQLNMIRHVVISRFSGRNGFNITQQPSAANGWVLKWAAKDWDDSAGYYEAELTLFT